MEPDEVNTRFGGVMEFALSQTSAVGVYGSKTVRVGASEYPAELVRRVLEPIITDDRRSRIDEVVSRRTFDVATVVEGLGNVGNISAVMRTAEALGFQPFHVIKGTAVHKVSERTTQGAHKWLDVFAWDSAEDAVSHLKSAGYKVYVTALTPDARGIEDVNLSGRSALVFGNERSGASEQMLSLADEVIAVRTPGFVESFNISVAAAVCLYHLYQYRREHHIPPGTTDEQRDVLRATFYARSVRDAEAILARAASEERSW